MPTTHPMTTLSWAESPEDDLLTIEVITEAEVEAEVNTWPLEVNILVTVTILVTSAMDFETELVESEFDWDVDDEDDVDDVDDVEDVDDVDVVDDVELVEVVEEFVDEEDEVVELEEVVDLDLDVEVGGCEKDDELNSCDEDDEVEGVDKDVDEVDVVSAELLDKEVLDAESTETDNGMIEATVVVLFATLVVSAAVFWATTVAARSRTKREASIVRTCDCWYSSLVREIKDRSKWLSRG